MGRWRTTRLVARARLLIGLATRSSIVLPAVCSCVSVLFCSVVCKLYCSSDAVASCVQHCVSVLFAALARAWLAIFCGSYARTLSALLGSCFFAALRAHTLCLVAFWPQLVAAKPDTKRPPPCARPRVHAAFQSSYLRWTGDFRGRRQLVKQQTTYHFIAFCSVLTV